MSSIRSNLHTHTTYSDGTSTMEECVQAALEKGFVSLGFSDHAYAPYDGDCCIKEADVPRYFREFAALREKYAGSIRLCLGWENDYYHPAGREGVDFLIGSAHYLADSRTGKYHCIDHLPAMLAEALEAVAFGDMRNLVERYYTVVEDIALRQKPDILGHVDLITKLNRDSRYFNAESGWYRSLLERAASAIARSGCIVEINTGSMARGYTDRPFPSPALLRMLCQKGVPVTISSDAHSAKDLDYGFGEMAELAKEVGYTSTRQLLEGAFRDVPL